MRKQTEAEKAYNDGYYNGIEWDSPYTPGGPWVFYARPTDSEEFKEKARLSQEIHDAWLQGWKDGVAQQGHVE